MCNFTKFLKQKIREIVQLCNNDSFCLMQIFWENQNFKIFSTFSNPKVVHQSKWICLRRFCQILGLIANPDLIRPVAICFKDCIYQSNIFGNNTMIPFMYFYAVFIYEGNFRLPLNVSIICKYIHLKNVYLCPWN